MFGIKRTRGNTYLFSKPSLFTKIRLFLRIKTRREREIDALNKLAKRLSSCFTTIDLDLAEEAKKDKAEREKNSQIKPRRSFSVEELQQIDEIAAIKRKGIAKAPEIDFEPISSNMVKQIDEQVYVLAGRVFEYMKLSLGNNFDHVMETLSNRWNEIDRSESQCWTYDCNDMNNYENLGASSKIAEAILVDRSVESLVNIRNSVIYAAENAFMLEFEKLLVDEVRKYMPEYVSPVLRVEEDEASKEITPS